MTTDQGRRHRMTGLQAALRIGCLAVIAWLPCGAVHASDTGDPLPTLRRVYRQQEAAIAKAFDAQRAAAREHYAADLRVVLRHMQRTGDEFGERPVRAEIERFKAEQTVPRDSPAGTPELLTKARARYHEALAPGAKERDARMDQLTRQYVSRLEAFVKQHGTDTAEAGRYTGEIERVTGGEAPEDEADDAGIRLPRDLLRGLALAYTFEDMDDRRVRDLSGSRRHGLVMGADMAIDPVEGVVCTFTGAYDMLEPESVPLSSTWTISARVRFPLAASQRQRVLASGGFGRDHVAVDPRGQLGATDDGRFTPSPFNGGDLSGWHELTAVGTYSRTLFFVDGRPVAAVKTVCHEPLKVIGNSKAGGRPWGGAVSSVMAWRRALSGGEVDTLVKTLTQDE